MANVLSRVRLLFLISAVAAIGCKSQSGNNGSEKTADTTTIEYPRPGSDANIDSLKKVIEQKRANKNRE